MIYERSVEKTGPKLVVVDYPVSVLITRHHNLVHALTVQGGHVVA
jgi:hypothetical protein